MPVRRLPVVCPRCGTAFTAVVVLPKPGRGGSEVQTVRVACRRRHCRHEFEAPVAPPRRDDDTPLPPG